MFVQSEVYVVDNWEVAREHIEKDEEPLGKGSFGLVFRGVYNHPTKVSHALCVHAHHAPYLTSSPNNLSGTIHTHQTSLRTSSSGVWNVQRMKTLT